MGEDGVEKFVSTPEPRSDDAIDPDPLPPWQVWEIAPGGPETGSSLYRIGVTVGRGGVRILNTPIPPAFRESTRYAEQNLYARARELVGDREMRCWRRCWSSRRPRPRSPRPARKALPTCGRWCR